MPLFELVSSYLQTRRLRFANRAALEAHQRRQWTRHARKTLTRSPYFSPWVGRPLAEWPTMDKAQMMRHFDEMNTVGLRLDEVVACAQGAEQSRDFSPRVGRYSVGLSSGTSNSRAVFAVCPQEQSQWAGVMLARLLPQGLLKGERVALLLRANNNLYRSVRTPSLSFAFFDLFRPLDEHLRALDRLQPTLLVAPAQVLCAIAAAQRARRVHLQPRRVVSVAEVLEPQDRALLSEVFGRVDEIYQATEGFLGSTCALGALHLNEEFLIVEPQWLDEDRFVPLITDFTRRTQPIVRYRLDDVLVRRRAPCACGRHTLVLERIEGRCDDVLRLPGQGGTTVEVFGDVSNRALAQILPTAADYRLVQTGPAALELWIDSPNIDLHRRVCEHLTAVMAGLSVDAAVLTWSRAKAAPTEDFTIKRRRIRRLSWEAGR